MIDAGALIGRDPESGAPLRISFAQGEITAIEPLPSAACPSDIYVAPGLVDMQVNGYAGADVNVADVTSDTVAELVRAQRRVGTLTFLPTLVTASRESLLRGLTAIATAWKADEDVAHAIPAIHVEGPWIAPEDGARGAHPREHVREPSIEEFDAWQEASGGLVGMVTLSPHYDNACEVIATLSSRGVLVSIGHTSATESQINAAVDAGATLSTHLGNGISQMLPRHNNPIWVQLGEDRLTAGMISDGFHLPPPVFRSMLRAKGAERVILVSDSVGTGGLPPGRYRGIGGDVELTSEGRLGIMGTEYLAGSAMNLAQCVAIAARMANLSLHEALALATHNPGALIGDRGRLEVGAPADLFTFSWRKGESTLAVREIIANGKQFQ